MCLCPYTRWEHFSQQCRCVAGLKVWWKSIVTWVWFQLKILEQMSENGCQTSFDVETVLFQQQFNTFEVLQQLRKPIRVDVRFLIPLNSFLLSRLCAALTPSEKFSTVWKVVRFCLLYLLTRCQFCQWSAHFIQKSKTSIFWYRIAVALL